MKKLIDISEFDHYIKERSIFVFTSKRCIDCCDTLDQVLILEDLFLDYQFIIVDYDEQLLLVDHLHIYGVPSLVAFNRGREIARLVNKSPKSLLELINFVKNIEN